MILGEDPTSEELKKASQPLWETMRKMNKLDDVERLTREEFAQVSASASMSYSGSVCPSCSGSVSVN